MESSYYMVKDYMKRSLILNSGSFSLSRRDSIGIALDLALPFMFDVFDSFGI